MIPDGYYDRVALWCTSERYAREIEALLNRLDLPCDSDLLDIGCGTGAGMNFAFRRGLRVVGIDKPKTWIGHCPVRPVVRADAARLPFRSASFDGVLLFHVLAHLNVVEICLSEIRRVLRRGGRVAISTPNADYLDALKQAFAVATTYIPDPTVRGHFTSERVKTLLTASGFIVSHASTFDPAPNPPGLPGERLFFLAERNEHDAPRIAEQGLRRPEDLRLFSPSFYDDYLIEPLSAIGFPGSRNDPGAGRRIHKHA